MYYLLVYRPDGETDIVAEPRLPDGVSFLTGALITEPLPDPLVVTVDTPAGGTPPDYLDESYPILSDRIVETLKRLGVDNLQLFPALLRNPKTREQWDNYCAVNVVGLVSCLAVAESGASETLPPLHTFQLSDMVIEEERTEGALFFRLLESPYVVLVNTRVGDPILDATPAFTGVQFRDVESI